MRAILLTIALSVTVGAAGGPAAAEKRSADPAVERGHDLAMRRCAECHAIGYGRESPDGDAPRFVDLRMRYNLLSLEKHLAGIPWGEHAGMPPVGLTEGDRADLSAYIESLRSPHR